MNPENLKMVTDAIVSLGVNGKDAFIWWVILKEGLPVLGWLLTFAGLLWIIPKLVSQFRDQTLENIRDLLGVGSRGEITDQEKRDVMEELGKMLQR